MVTVLYQELLSLACLVLKILVPKAVMVVLTHFKQQGPKIRNEINPKCSFTSHVLDSQLARNKIHNNN